MCVTCFFKKAIFIFCCLLPATVFAAEKKPPEIYMVVWNGCDDACRGFSDVIAESGFPVKTVLRDVQKDKTKLPEFIREAKEKMPDLLVTWGTEISLKMLGTADDINVLRYVTGVPAVFMVVSQPVESGLVSGLISQGRAVTGVSQSVSLSEQLQSARSYFPFKRIGVIYTPSEINSTVVVDKLKLYAPMLSYELVALPVEETNGQPDAKSLPRLVSEMADKKIDLLYLGPDAFLNAHRDDLTKETMLHNIPVLASSEGAVRNGDALFAFVNRYYTVGAEAGKKALQILKDGIPAYDIPITSPQRFLAVVNMEVAEKLSLYPPLSFLPNADLIKTPKKPSP